MQGSGGALLAATLVAATPYEAKPRLSSPVGRPLRWHVPRPTISLSALRVREAHIDRADLINILALIHTHFKDTVHRRTHGYTKREANGLPSFFLCFRLLDDGGVLVGFESR